MAPRMAVAGYFYFDGKKRLGKVTDWAWAMAQWDAVAAAGAAVRVVVVDWSYAYNMPLTASHANTPNATEMKAKLVACRRMGQAVFGYVAGSNGAIPLDRPPNNQGPWWTAPRDKDTGLLTGVPTPAPVDAEGAHPCLRDQIDTWMSIYPGLLDGIYVDEGPVDCMAPNSPAEAIPSNYAKYCAYIRAHDWQVFLLAPQYDDNDPHAPGWLRQLSPDYIGLWEGNLGQYRAAYNSYNACPPSWTAWPNAASNWWLTDPSRQQTRVHIVNGGVEKEATETNQTNAQVLAEIRELALSRGAATMWITEAPVDPVLGSLYGIPPPYWADEVALFRAAVSVPDVRGQAETDALRTLGDDGLEGRTIREITRPNVDGPMVVEQSIAPGTVVPVGTGIDLIVAVPGGPVDPPGPRPRPKR